MSVSYALHFLLAGWSVLTGVALGILYEFFRFLHRLHRRAAWLIFLEDLLFCLCCSAAMALLFFNLSYGQMRLYAFAGAVLGFLLWYCTVGALFRRAMSKLYRALLPPCRRWKARQYTKRESLRFRRRAKAGFGVRRFWRKQIRRKKENATEP